MVLDLDGNLVLGPAVLRFPPGRCLCPHPSRFGSWSTCMTLFASRLRQFAAVSILAVCAALPVVAQTAALGGIAGIVRDSSGGVVAGATVVVTNSGTGAVRTLTTDADGHYAASFLQPGQYEVVAGGGTFGKTDQKNVAVTVGSTVTVDAALPVATVTT